MGTALRNMDGNFMPFLLAQLGAITDQVVHHGEDHDVEFTLNFMQVPKDIERYTFKVFQTGGR